MRALGSGFGDQNAHEQVQGRAAKNSRSSLSADVLVVGAGPTGCTAAMAFAARGAQVVLADGQPGAARRFAGEWLHPQGVRKLSHLGVNTRSLSRSDGNGFVLFAPGEEPVQLPYSRGMSLARVHHELVEDLRAEAAARRDIDYRPGLAFAGFDGEAAVLRDSKSHRQIQLRVGRVIGADGRNSKVRSSLGVRVPNSPISFMMGVELSDCELPFEGLGHVISGGPGPALLYRIDERRVRACLDIPTWFGGQARKKSAVHEAFRQVLPQQLHKAFERGLRDATPWAATRFQPRACFGQGQVWLAGDAVGHIHPVTGMGMTQGILDAVAVAESATLDEYSKHRQSYVVELLTNALYHLLQRNDESARRVRHGMFRMLHRSATERRRTMEILTGEDERRTSFVGAFVKASGLSIGAQLSDEGTPLAWGLASSQGRRWLHEDLGWLKWPLSALVPPAAGGTKARARGSFLEPLPTAEELSLPWPQRTSLS